MGAPCHPHVHDTGIYPPSVHRAAHSQLLEFVFAKENTTHMSPEVCSWDLCSSVQAYCKRTSFIYNQIPRDAHVQIHFGLEVLRLVCRMPAPVWGWEKHFTWCHVHPVMRATPHSHTHAEPAVFHVCIVANNSNLFLPILLNMQMWMAHQD